MIWYVLIFLLDLVPEIGTWDSSQYTNNPAKVISSPQPPRPPRYRPMPVNSRSICWPITSNIRFRIGHSLKIWFCRAFSPRMRTPAPPFDCGSMEFTLPRLWLLVLWDMGWHDRFLWWRFSSLVLWLSFLTPNFNVQWVFSTVFFYSLYHFQLVMSPWRYLYSHVKYGNMRFRSKKCRNKSLMGVILGYGYSKRLDHITTEI